MEIRFLSRKYKSGQFAIEFILLFGIMMIIFLTIVAIITSKVIDAKEQERYDLARDVSELAQAEISLAGKVLNGYNRTFFLPELLSGSSYGIEIIGNKELVVTYIDQEYVVFLPDSVEGNVSPGANTISKINGTIFLNR